MKLREDRGRRVTIYLHGIPGQERTNALLRVCCGVATVEDEYSESGESHYHLEREGRQCDQYGSLTPWDFWRLRVADVLRSDPTDGGAR